MIGRVIASRRDDPLLADASIDPMLLASTIAGGSVFYLAAIPGLLSERATEPVSGERLEALRDAVLRITRRLLGTRGPRAGSGRSRRDTGRGR